MLEEIIKFCEKQQHSTLKDIRIVLFNQDQNLVNAFCLEAKKIPTKGTKTVKSTGGSKWVDIVEVVRGDLTKEKTDAIVNIIGPDMNMDAAGQLSKAIAQASGPQVQQECNRIGKQTPGKAVMTSGGNLSVRQIIHIVPGLSDKQHLQTCLEEGLLLADSNNLQSISIPSIGTGGFGLCPKDSAQLTFQALQNISGNFNSISKVRVVVFQAKMVQDFHQEQQKYSLVPDKDRPSKSRFGSRFSVEIVNDDLTKEKTDAIVNIIGPDMNMDAAGQLSKAIARASGAQVQQECNRIGKQTPGSAVMTSGGNLSVPNIIHIVPGSSDKQHLQTCLEEGLHLADKSKLRSISIPAIGTGDYGLSAKDSAKVIFLALKRFRLSCNTISTVRIVIFQSSMFQDFQQEQKGQEEPGLQLGYSKLTRSDKQTSKLSLRVKVVGGSKISVDKAVVELKKIFSKACTTKKVDIEGIGSLSKMQITHLQSEAYKGDMELFFDDTSKCISVRGYPEDIPDMVSKITKDITRAIKKEKQRQEDENAQTISELVEWSYTVKGKKKLFDKNTNAQLERVHKKKASTVKVPLEGQEFDIDLKAMTGRGRRNGEQITVTRRAKGGNCYFRALVIHTNV